MLLVAFRCCKQPLAYCWMPDVSKTSTPQLSPVSVKYVAHAQPVITTPVTYVGTALGTPSGSLQHTPASSAP